MSVSLRFDSKTIKPLGSRDDAQAIADWADETGMAPDVVKFFEEGESHDIGSITEQLAKAKAIHEPDADTGHHVVKFLRTLEESDALTVDLVEEDDNAEITKSLTAMQSSIESLTAKMQAGPQPVLNVTVPEIEIKLSDNPFGDGFQKSLRDAVEAMGKELALGVINARPPVVNVEPSPVSMPPNVLALDAAAAQALVQVCAAMTDRLVEAIRGVSIVVNVPKPDPFGIAVTRDKETGLATRFDPVTKE